MDPSGVGLGMGLTVVAVVVHAVRLAVVHALTLVLFQLRDSIIVSELRMMKTAHLRALELLRLRANITTYLVSGYGQWHSLDSTIVHLIHRK